jgi:acylphosphatase
MHHVHLLIRGRVQGVGFRYFVASGARALGVDGSVRNCSSGDVEVEAEGDRAALQALVEAVRQGPAGARITHVEEHWSEGPTRHQGFRIMA